MILMIHDAGMIPPFNNAGDNPTSSNFIFLSRKKKEKKENTINHRSHYTLTSYRKVCKKE